LILLRHIGSEKDSRYIFFSATLEQKGPPIGSMDLLITAHALSLAVRLVTTMRDGFGAFLVYVLRAGFSEGIKAAIPRRARLFAASEPPMQ
jgi:hypothetical protein